MVWEEAVWHGGKNIVSGVIQTWVQSLVLSLNSPVTLVKLLNFQL